MNAYPDTSFLCALYRQQTNSLLAANFVSTLDEPIHVSSPLLFEFRQSIRFQIWLNQNDSGRGFSLSKGRQALVKFQENMASGAIVLVPVSWPEIAATAERLSAQYTTSNGSRAFDIIHVATALHLGARQFLTFDQNQKQLAASENLLVPF